MGNNPYREVTMGEVRRELAIKTNHALSAEEKDELMPIDIFAATSGTQTHTLSPRTMVSVVDLLTVFPELAPSSENWGNAEFAEKVRLAAIAERQADALAQLRAPFQAKIK